MRLDGCIGLVLALMVAMPTRLTALQCARPVLQRLWSQSAHIPSLPRQRLYAMSDTLSAEERYNSFADMKLVAVQTVSLSIALTTLLLRTLTRRRLSLAPISSRVYSSALGYVAIASVAHILQSANKRRRLDGNTFKILAPTMLIASVTSFSLLPRPLSALLIASSSVSAVPIIAKQGLPKLKPQCTDLLSGGCIIAFIVTLLEVVNRYPSPTLMPGKVVSLGTLVCLHGAALVGPTRLASATYQALAKLVIVDSFLSLAGARLGYDIGMSVFKIALAVAVVIKGKSAT